MNADKRREHSVSGLFAFALVGLFTLLALTIVLAGVRSYRAMGDTSQLVTQERIALGYVSGKLRGSGNRNSVSFREEQGVRLLVIRDEADGESYETRIYAADGILREQFCDASVPFSPEDGEQIVALPDFTFYEEGARVVLRAHLSDGTVAVTSVALRAGEGGETDAL